MPCSLYPPCYRSDLVLLLDQPMRVHEVSPCYVRQQQFLFCNRCNPAVHIHGITVITLKREMKNWICFSSQHLSLLLLPYLSLKKQNQKTPWQTVQPYSFPLSLKSSPASLWTLTHTPLNLCLPILPTTSMLLPILGTPGTWHMGARMHSRSIPPWGNDFFSCSIRHCILNFPSTSRCSYSPLPVPFLPSSSHNTDMLQTCSRFP